MITSEEVEKAINWVRDHAEKAAMARAHLVYVQEYRKCVKAKCMRDAEVEGVGAISKQEREAYCNVEYITHLQAIQQAVKEDMELHWLRAAAIAKVDAWRTLEATRRSAEERV